MRARIVAASAATLLLPGVALAHPGAGEAAGLAAGFLHPLGGADHVATMVAVGLWAGLLGGALRLRLPAAFLAGMAAGAVAGGAGIGVPAAEAGILATVILAGGLVAAAVRPPAGPALAIAALFGALHGYAHGAAMAPEWDALGYGVGFLAATALLHGLGLGLVLVAHCRRSGLTLARAAGGAACLLVALGVGLG